MDRSFCVSSGIIERRTGEGIARFYFTLRNTGPRRGKVNVTPVFVFDDRTITESVRKTLVGIVVPAHTVRTDRSPAYTYHARSHTIIGCGLLINGQVAVPINYI